MNSSTENWQQTKVSFVDFSSASPGQNSDIVLLRVIRGD